MPRVAKEVRISLPEPALERTFGEHRLYVGDDHGNSFNGGHTEDLGLGRGGDDMLAGGAGEDELLGMGGNDRLSGGDGADHLVGGDGADNLSGGGEADTLRGGGGNDTLDEGAGHGDLEGGAGDDILIGGLGADAFVISPDSGNDVIRDFVAGRGMFDHLAIMGLQPEDLRFEDTPSGVLISWSTADGTGSVLLEGVSKSELAQDDFMFTDNRHLINETSITSDHVTAQHFERDEAPGGSATNNGADDHAQFQQEVGNTFVRYGSDHDETFQGTDRDDLSYGLGGNDTLFGAAGDDHLDGDAGNDILDGGDGSDDLRGGMGDDTLYGGAMADNLMGGDGNDVLDAGGGHDMVEGGAGDDILDGGDGADAFIVSNGSGNDIIVGGFEAGPGAFDHIAFTDILPDEVTVEDALSPNGDGQAGVLVSWSDGSIFIVGVAKEEMSQDDFMFNAVEGGAFVPDPTISTMGSNLIFASMSHGDHLFG